MSKNAIPGLQTILEECFEEGSFQELAEIFEVDVSADFDPANWRYNQTALKVKTKSSQQNHTSVNS